MDKVPSRTSTDPEKLADTSSVGSSPAPVVDPVLERTVWRKLDRWILPVVTMFYLLSFLDRTNVSNARVAGLQKDLKMSNKEYSIALTVTYVPYIVAELPSNLLLKIVGPNLMLPAMLSLWGLITTMQGVVKTYHGLLVCRFFLGLFEGGVFPGLVLYLSFFYPRQRLQTRIASFFSAASISGAFSGILAYGIIRMNNVGSRPGWAWIFILEGLFTILFGLSSFFLLPRSPTHARFLNDDEKAYIVAKLREDGALGRDDTVDSFSWSEVWKAFTLPQVGLVALIFFFDGVVLYGLAYFTPSIIQSLGYTAANAQLMSVPPFAVAFVVAMISAFVSDRYGCRGIIATVSSLLCVIGFAMFLGSTIKHVQYGSLFLSITGTYVLAPTLCTWNANNAAPHVRRATAIAIGFIMTNSGGILATWLLGSLSPAPRYTLATRTLLIMSVLMAAISVVNTFYLSWQNKKKAAVRSTTSRHEEKEGLGDQSAWFIYSL